MIEEMEKETSNKQWQRRDEYCLRIQKAMQYKGNCDHEDVPSILVDYEKEIKKELIPENAVVVQRAEYNDLKGLEKHFDDYLIKEVVATRKETTEKYLNKAREILAKLMEIYEDNPIVLEGHLQDVFKNEWGVELDGSEN